MQHNQDIRLIVKCCTKHYCEGISQQQIAKQLGISHPTVCRLIKQGREMGIVRTQVINPLEREEQNAILERKLEQYFGLKEAVVTWDRGDTGEQKLEIGRVAFEYLQRVMGRRSIVGVSMGTSLEAVHKATNDTCTGLRTFVPLLGGVGQNTLGVQPNELVASYAQKFGGRAIFLHAPSFVTNPAVKESLLEEASTQEVLTCYEDMDICVLGIGSPHDDGCVLMQAGLYDKATIDELFSMGMVGDICMQFFDINGNHHRFEINNRVFGIELDRLKTVQRSIGLASGVEKTKAVVGALRAGLINVLITHHSLAADILEFENSAATKI